MLVEFIFFAHDKDWKYHLQSRLIFDFIMFFCNVKPWWKCFSKLFLPIIGHMISIEYFLFEVGDTFFSFELLLNKSYNHSFNLLIRSGNSATFFYKKTYNHATFLKIKLDTMLPSPKINQITMQHFEEINHATHATF